MVLYVFKLSQVNYSVLANLISCTVGQHGPKETKNKRLAAKCAKLCLSQVITSVTIGDDDKRLCYRSDNELLWVKLDQV